MSISDVAMRLSTILTVQTCLDCSNLSPSTHIIHDLNLDSLDLIQVAIAIEDEFSISIPDDKLMELATVGVLTAYIIEHAAVSTQEVNDGDPDPGPIPEPDRY